MHEPVLNRETFRRDLIAFIAGLVRVRRKTVRDDIEIDEHTRLFETGLVDSLGILELLAFVETITDRPIPLKAVDVRHFGTVDRICRHFGPAEDLQ